MASMSLAAPCRFRRAAPFSSWRRGIFSDSLRGVGDRETPTISSIRERLPRRREDLLGVRQDRALEGAVEADGRERRADAVDGRVEVLEELRRDARDQLPAESAVDLVLVDGEDAGRLLHGGGDGVPVERHERAEVENFDALSLFRERLGGG